MVGDAKEGDGMATAGFSQIAGLECIQSEKITSRRKKPDEKKTTEFRFSSLAAVPWQNLEARHSETFRGISSVLFYSIACRTAWRRNTARVVRRRRGEYPLGAHVVHHPA